MTRQVLSLAVLAVGCTALCGCGGTAGQGIQVTGKVTLDGKALSDVDVVFIPDAGTPGNGGAGRTNSEGVYTLQPRGQGGIEPGAYRVVLSRLLRPDGTPLPADSPTDPMSSDAKESLPPRYSSLEETTLSATVSADSGPADFQLTGAASP